jgi:hypothetical protein
VKAAGVEVVKVEIGREGKIVVVSGKADAPHQASEIVL